MLFRLYDHPKELVASVDDEQEVKNDTTSIVKSTNREYL
jgi:hypothetical protein